MIRRFDPLVLLAAAVLTVGCGAIAAIEARYLVRLDSGPAPWLHPQWMAPVLALAALLLVLCALDGLAATLRTLLETDGHGRWWRVLVALGLCTAPLVTLHPLVITPALSALLLLHRRTDGAWARGPLLVAAVVAMGCSVLVLPLLTLFPTVADHAELCWTGSYLVALAALVWSAPARRVGSALCWLAAAVHCTAPLFTWQVWPSVL